MIRYHKDVNYLGVLCETLNSFIILSSKNNVEWLFHAKKALEIFTITTTIEGHHPQHDQALRNVKNWLGLKD